MPAALGGRRAGGEAADDQEGEEREWGVPQAEITTTVDVLAWRAEAGEHGLPQDAAPGHGLDAGPAAMTWRSWASRRSASC